MLRVEQNLCIGCGLCADSCRQGAISLQSGQARINQVKCNHCGVCLDVCPRHAILKVVMVSEDDLKSNLISLRNRSDDILKRIEKLKAVR